LGYVDVEVTRDNILSKTRDRIRGHIFHWSYITGNDKGAHSAYRIKRPFAGNKEDGADKGLGADGFIKWNVLASYTHLHFASNIGFAENFIRSCLRW